MAYNEGKRPCKSNHTYIIKDADVQAFIEDHELPKESDSISLIEEYLVDVNYKEEERLEYIVAVDGGDTTVPVKKKFPSAAFTFFQFGANLLSTSDLKDLKKQPFISPASIAKLKDLERIKFVLPTKNIGRKLHDGSKDTPTRSVRKVLYEFFKKHDYLDTLKWFLFREYLSQPLSNYSLASHPEDHSAKNVIIDRKKIDTDHIISHPAGEIFLTDIFRLHEVVDDDIGAGGIIGYLRNLIEHIIIIDTIRGVYRSSKERLNEVLFIKDGPLGFFGQTANMHEPMRDLINHLSKEINIHLVGVEKSGIFVEHAFEIAEKIKPGQAYLLSNKHIYTYIKAGDADNSPPYGSTSYYSSKIIFKSRDERLHVVTLPTKDSDTVLNPKKENFRNIDIILEYVERLKSDMYDNALFPIALVNKLVSISDHPSSALLEKFAKRNIS